MILCFSTTGNDQNSNRGYTAIINELKEYSDELVKTITFDRSKEFPDYKEIKKS